MSPVLCFSRSDHRQFGFSQSDTVSETKIKNLDVIVDGLYTTLPIASANMSITSGR